MPPRPDPDRRAAAPSPAPADPTGAGPSTLRFGPFVLDGPGGRLLRDGAAVALAPKPFAVLAHLAARPGRLVTKDELLDAVWGHRFVSDSVLKVAMNGLRAALGDDAKAPRWLHTVPRRGYRFADDVDASAAAANPQAPAPMATAAAAPAIAVTKPAAAEPLRPGTLPAVGAPLWGRDEDLARLQAALAGHRLVTLVGPGGVGKTRLAIAAMAAPAPAHAAPPRDGVWLLRLDALARPAQVPAALARAIGLSAEAGRSVAALAQALSPLAARIVLDNAEHLLDAAPAEADAATDPDAATLTRALAVWLAAAPQLQWLVTSQRALRLAGEQVLPLAPLPAPPAVELLVARIQALLPGWRADAAAADDLRAIAAALDGLPLALELAAARVPLLGTAGVRARLGERLRLLTRGAADAPDRHRTLQAALAWSVGLLPPRAAALLARLSVFAGGFTLDAAQAVAGDEPWATVDDLDELRERSLVVAAEGQRLRLLDSVRVFAAERLAADPPAQAAARAAHGAWVLACFAAADARATASGEDRWLGPLLPEAENLQAAMAHALHQADTGDAGVDAALDLFSATALFCVRAGLRQDAAGWMRRLQARLAAPGTPAPPPTLATRWQVARALLGALGQILPPDEALAAAEAALGGAAGWTGPADGARRLYLQYHRAMLLLRVGRGAEVPPVRAAMEALLGPAPTHYERRMVRWIDAVLARDRGDIDAYGAFWAETLAESRSFGDAVEGWRAAWGLGQTLFLQDRPDEACEVLDRAVDTMRAQARLRAFAPIAAQAAVLRVARDASPDTLDRLREAVALLRGDGMVWWLADALAWVPLHQGRSADAVAVQAWADGLVAQRGDSRGPVFAKLRAAFAARCAVPPQAAGTVGDEAAALRLALGDG
ncbi:ATP-binding protein [Rubrivivax sp. RP6-9]|uniref:ATP-binding protein n=1 Tax=Rubrivivax sp. RP6-9 TaxID=3415750 RepID=UPI003CC63254